MTREAETEISLIADSKADSGQERRKCFLRSRRLAAVTLPLFVAIGATFDLDPSALSDQLQQLGDNVDRFVTAALSLWAALAALWSFLRPDHARLRALPKRSGERPKNAGSYLGTAGLIFLILAAACATPSAQRYARAEILWTAAIEGYNRALEQDRAFLEACRARVEEPASCQPMIDRKTRAQALEVIDRGNALLDDLAAMLGEPEPDDAEIDRILSTLERLALELALREVEP